MTQSTIRMGGPEDFVEVRVLEHSAGDRRLGVSVRSDTFAGSYDQVWVAAEGWSSFLAALARLERERSGEASLVSMSQEEFELRVEIVDRAGRAAARGHLARPGVGATTRARIDYRVAIDPETLSELLARFEAASKGSVADRNG